MSAPTLPEIRHLLNELHYIGDGGGAFEQDLATECERTLRWLLEQYLRRGTHTTNDPAVTE